MFVDFICNHYSYKLSYFFRSIRNNSKATEVTKRLGIVQKKRAGACRLELRKYAVVKESSELEKADKPRGLPVAAYTWEIKDAWTISSRSMN